MNVTVSLPPYEVILGCQQELLAKSLSMDDHQTGGSFLRFFQLHLEGVTLSRNGFAVEIFRGFIK
jgi:hypothetical protein